MGRNQPGLEYLSNGRGRALVHGPVLRANLPLPVSPARDFHDLEGLGACLCGHSNRRDHVFHCCWLEGEIHCKESLGQTSSCDVRTMPASTTISATLHCPGGTSYLQRDLCLLKLKVSDLSLT